VAVAEFTDANLLATTSDFAVTIDWGDGSPESAGTLIQPGRVGTPFFVTGNHLYVKPTTSTQFTVSVHIVDNDGATVNTTTVANVTASTITGTLVTINEVEAKPFGPVTVATFSDSGIPGPLSSYSATIDWGLGQGTVIGQIVRLGGNNFAVQGSFTYPEESPVGLPYPITVVISHNGVAATTVVSQAVVTDAPISGAGVPFFATEGTAFVGTVAIITDQNPNATAADFTATISWGDGTTSTGTVTQNGTSFIVSSADPVSGLGHAYLEEGSYTFRVRVTNDGDRRPRSSRPLRSPTPP
jgi:hypothetical protein